MCAYIFIYLYIYTHTELATNWHLPSTATRIKSGAAEAADLQHSLKGAQAGEQKEGTLNSGKTGRTGLQIVRSFQELIL